MTLFLGSGLLKRIETPEGYSSFTPVFGGVAEDFEQLLAGFTVEPGVIGQLFEHDHETRLLAGFVDQIGHAIEQSVQIFAEMSREQERLRNTFQHILFGLRGR
jgi:hypothetical protein